MAFITTSKGRVLGGFKDACLKPMFTFSTQVLFCMLLVVLQLTSKTEAAVTNVAVSIITDTAATLTVTYDPAPTAGTVSYTVNGGLAVTVTSFSPILLTTLTPCFANIIAITQVGSPAYPVTVNTLPPRVTNVAATGSNSGTITVTWTASTTAPSPACPYWITVNVDTTGTTTVLWTQPVNNNMQTAIFYDVPAATYDVYVFATTLTANSPLNAAVSVTVPAYTTTLATTTATTTAIGGQFIASITGVVYFTGAVQVVYQPSQSVLGSAAYNVVAVPLCQGLQALLAPNSTIKDAFERCYVSEFKNGTLIGTSVLVFTRNKLPTFTTSSLQNSLATLLSGSPSATYYYIPATSPITITVTSTSFALRLPEANVLTMALSIGIIALFRHELAKI